MSIQTDTAPPNSSSARGGFRQVVAETSGDSMSVQVQAGEFTWSLDEPVSLGGQGAAPDPVTSFLGALCGCLLISLQITANARRVPLAGASASAKVNEKGFVKTVDIDLTVRSGAPEDVVRTVVQRAEKGCYIRGLLKESIEYRLSLTILPA